MTWSCMQSLCSRYGWERLNVTAFARAWAMSETKSVSRAWVARAFTLVEDVVYLGLALLLSIAAIVLLLRVAYTLAANAATDTFAYRVIGLLDQMLLILLIVELLYTVQVSFREHTIAAEPFLLVGVIAAIRRVLVLTAEFSHLPQQSDALVRQFLAELAVMTVLILVLVICLLLLRKRGGGPVAERA